MKYIVAAVLVSPIIIVLELDIASTMNWPYGVKTVSFPAVPVVIFDQ
jgi:hypothetical protein